MSSNMVAHAERELRISGQTEEDPEFSQSLVNAVRAFAEYGHSGFSAAYGADALNKLLRFKTLTTLTSDPEEWTDVSEHFPDPTWQSVRDPSAFSTDGGKTWHYLEDDPE